MNEFFVFVVVISKQCLHAVLTYGLQMDVDEVEAIVLQAVVRLGWDVQVAVALLVAQVHLNL